MGGLDVDPATARTGSFVVSQFALIVRAVAIALLLAAPMPGWEALAVQGETPAAASESVYVDPVERFRLPLPTGWTAEADGDVGVISSREGGITVYALVMPASDIPTALDAALPSALTPPALRTALPDVL